MLPLIPGGDFQLSHIRDFKIIAEMLDLLPPAINVTLTRCAMGHPRGGFNVAGRLTLQDIETDEDLVPLLRRWQGRHLHVDNCPGFNDVVLDMMATVAAHGYFSPPLIAQLSISNCPNFSVATLRRLLRARSQVIDGSTSPGISILRVSGLAPEISTVDQQQISQHVHEFHLDPSSS
jgi:hypothetical protein